MTILPSVRCRCAPGTLAPLCPSISQSSLEPLSESATYSVSTPPISTLLRRFVGEPAPRGGISSRTWPPPDGPGPASPPASTHRFAIRVPDRRLRNGPAPPEPEPPAARPPPSLPKFPDVGEAAAGEEAEAEVRARGLPVLLTPPPDPGPEPEEPPSGAAGVAGVAAAPARRRLRRGGAAAGDLVSKPSSSGDAGPRPRRRDVDGDGAGVPCGTPAGAGGDGGDAAAAAAAGAAALARERRWGIAEA